MSGIATHRRGRRAPLLPLVLGGVSGLLGLGGVAACREPTVGVALRFPSEATFLLTNTITVDVYDGSGTGDEGPDAICRSLSVQTSVTPPGAEILESSGNRNACEALDGAIAFEHIAVGRRVFFAEAVDFTSTAILRGCTVADVFGDEQSLEGARAETAKALGANGLVEVQLATLPTYPDGVTPACENVAAKCEENKPCVE